MLILRRNVTSEIPVIHQDSGDPLFIRVLAVHAATNGFPAQVDLGFDDAEWLYKIGPNAVIWLREQQSWIDRGDR